MNPGSILIGLAMLIATIPWVVAPILNRKRMPEPKDDAEALEGDPHTEGLMALRDLDFDRLATDYAPLLGVPAATPEPAPDPD